MTTNETKTTRNRNWEKLQGVMSFAVNEGEISVVPCIEVNLGTLTMERFTVTLQGVNAQRISPAALLKRVLQVHPCPSGRQLLIDDTRDIEVTSAARYHVTDTTMMDYGTHDDPGVPCIKYSVYVTRDAYGIVSRDVDGTPMVDLFDYTHATARIPEREMTKEAQDLASRIVGGAWAYVASPMPAPERVTWYLPYDVAKEHALTDDELEELRNGGAVRRDK